MLNLKKVYQAVHTGEMELHLRRFLYQQKPEEIWAVFAFTWATFGDLAAGLLLEVAKRRVAQIGKDIDPVAAQQLEEQSYVDDTVMGGDRTDVERMRGTRVDFKYTGTVSRILAKGAMMVKFIAMSGSDDTWEEEQLGGKNLGVNYRIRTDEIFFKLGPNFYANRPTSLDKP